MYTPIHCPKCVRWLRGEHAAYARIVLVGLMRFLALSTLCLANEHSDGNSLIATVAYAVYQASVVRSYVSNLLTIWYCNLHHCLSLCKCHHSNHQCRPDGTVLTFSNMSHDEQVMHQPLVKCRKEFSNILVWWGQHTVSVTITLP